MIDYRKLGFDSELAFQFPTIINLETYRGACPCRCVHCPVGILSENERATHYGSEQMSINLFKKIIDETAQYPRSLIRLHATGEPILWRELTTAIQYAKEHHVKTWLFTSAITHNDDLLEKICQFVDIIEVSVNETSSTDYKKTKGIDQFDLVKQNLIKMRKYINKNQLSSRLLISRVQSFDQVADNAFVKFWNETNLADDVFVRTFHNYNDTIELNDARLSTLKKRDPCLVHWGRFNINVLGKATVCFNELFKKELREEVILGDVLVNSIQSIWQGEQLNAIRMAELSQRYDQRNFKNFPCATCRSCQKSSSKNKTSDSQLDRLWDC